MKRVWSDLSNSLTIHDVITQLERHIRVRRMPLKLNETLVFHHVFITNDKIALKLHIQRLLKRSLTWFINESINNDQEKHFKLQTNKLKSFEIKVYSTFLKVTETDWHSNHVHILRNFSTQSSSSSIVLGKRNLPSAMAKTICKSLQVHNVFGINTNLV